MNDAPYTISSTVVKNGILHLLLAPDTGSVFHFSAGQYATLRFKEGRGTSFERSFSITSSPLTKTQLEFGIRVMGSYTRQLAALKQGDTVWVRGPYGSFTFNPIRDLDLVFIAGGIGITPFLSMLRMISDTGLRSRVTLLYSNKKLDETPFLAPIQQLANQLPNLKIHYFVTDETASQKQQQNVHYQRLDRAWLAANLKPSTDQSFFVCGPSGFMDATRENLIALNIPEELIHQEDFSFAPPKIRKSDILFYLGGLSAATVITILLLVTVYRTEAAKTAAKQLAETVTPTSAQTTSQTTSPNPSKPSITQTPAPIVQPTTAVS